MGRAGCKYGTNTPTDHPMPELAQSTIGKPT